MSVLNVNKNNFDIVKGSDKPVLLDFYADWCGPCRMMSPIINEIAEERPDIMVGKVYVDADPELANSFGVISIPSIVVMQNGKILHQSVGARPKAKLLELLEG